MLRRTAGRQEAQGGSGEEQVGVEGVTPYQWPDGRRREGARELREGTGCWGAGRFGRGGELGAARGRGRAAGAGGRGSGDSADFFITREKAGGEACFPSVSGLGPP